MESQILCQSLIPPSPYTERGMASFLDIQESNMLYFNGSTLVIRHLDNINDVKTYQHKSDVKAAKLSYDGKLVSSIDEKGTLIIHQIGQKQLLEVKKYQNFFMGARSIDFTSDRKKICVVGASNKIFGRVASIDTGTNIGQITGVSSNLSACCFKSLKSNKLVVGGDQFNIKLYEGPPFKFVKSIKCHTNFINQIKYNPSGALFISVSSDKKIVLFDGEKVQIIKQKNNAHQGGIFGVDWINQNMFVTVSADKTIKLWNIQLEQLRVIKTCSQQELKDIKKIQYFQVGVKFYNNKIYSVGLNGNITVYNNPLLQNAPQQTVSIKGIKNKSKKVIKINDKQFIVLDSSGKILQVNSQNHLIKQVFDSSSRKSIIDGIWDKQKQTLLILWGDTSITSFKWQTNSSSFSQNFMIKQSNTNFICQSQKFQFIGANNSHIFAFQKQQEVIKSNLQEDPSFLTYYHNSQVSVILVGTIKGYIFVYNANNLDLLTKVKVSGYKITCLHFIENKIPTFICGDSSGQLKVWKINQQIKLQEISDSIGSHNSVVTSIKSIGKKIYTCGMDNKIYIWNVDETGTTYQRIYQEGNTHHLGVLDLQILNENSIITSGGDLLIKYWKI